MNDPNDCPAACTRCNKELLAGDSVCVITVDLVWVDPQGHHGYRLQGGNRTERHWLCSSCEGNVVLIGARR